MDEPAPVGPVAPDQKRPQVGEQGFKNVVVRQEERGRALLLPEPFHAHLHLLLLLLQFPDARGEVIDLKMPLLHKVVQPGEPALDLLPLPLDAVQQVRRLSNLLLDLLVDEADQPLEPLGREDFLLDLGADLGLDAVAVQLPHVTSLLAALQILDAPVVPDSARLRRRPRRASHGRPALGAARKAAEEVLARDTSRVRHLWSAFIDEPLNPSEGLFRDYRRHGSLEPHRLRASLVPDHRTRVDLVLKNVQNPIFVPRLTDSRGDLEVVQLRGNLLRSRSRHGSVEDLPDRRLVGIVDNERAPHLLTVSNLLHRKTQRRVAAVDEPTQGVLLHAARGVSSDPNRLTLVPRFNDRLHEDTLGLLRDRLRGRDNEHAVIAQLALEDDGCPPVPREARQLPDEDDVKGSDLRVVQHSIELLAVRVPAGPPFIYVHVLFIDGPSPLFREFPEVADLGGR